VNFQIKRLKTSKKIKPLFFNYHYLKTLARGCPDIYTIFDPITKKVIGACQVGIPATRHIDKNSHKEIRRLVLIPGVPKNTASYFISRIVKDIKKRYPKIEKMIAYSDPNAGHKGTIYLASNFKFVGQCKPSQSINVNGKKFHSRTAFNSNIGGSIKRRELNLAMKVSNYKWIKTKGKLKFEMELK
jgi:hypothetical protein